MAKKPLKKLRVEFEIDADAMEELIKIAGTPQAKRLSRVDLEELSKAGAIRASEFLVPAVAAESAIIGKFIGKAVSKATSKLSNKTVQRVAITEVVDKGVDMVSSLPSGGSLKSNRKA